MIKGPRIAAWWFNPRDGRSERLQDFNNHGEHEFVPPRPGEMLDWVLVLDDAARGYPPPGSRAASRPQPLSKP